jgi:hypothetical protein
MADGSVVLTGEDARHMTLSEVTKATGLGRFEGIGAGKRRLR